MTASLLERFLVGELFAFLLIFSRLGAALMLMPAFGETYVSGRARLLLGLAISVVLMPVTSPYLPAIPASPLALGILLAGEVMIGVFIGLLSRIILSALHSAGMFIAFQSGLAAAMMFDINAGSQGSPFGSLLSVTALVLIFALDLHHVMLQGIADSYSLFVPGMFPPVDDFANMAARLLSSVFALALALSTPHIVIGLVVYLGSGLLARLMPQMQVFFVIMPLQILISFFILLITVSTIMLVYMDYFEKALTGLLLPGR